MKVSKVLKSDFTWLVIQFFHTSSTHWHDLPRDSLLAYFSQFFSLSLSLSLSSVYLVFCRLLIHFNITSEFTLLTCQRHLTFSKWNISYKTKFSFKLQTIWSPKTSTIYSIKNFLEIFIVLVALSFNYGSIELFRYIHIIVLSKSWLVSLDKKKKYFLDTSCVDERCMKINWV